MDGFLAMKGGGQELPGGVQRRRQGGETCACCTLHTCARTHIRRARRQARTCMHIHIKAQTLGDTRRIREPVYASANILIKYNESPLNFFNESSTRG